MSSAAPLLALTLLIAACSPRRLVSSEDAARGFVYRAATNSISFNNVRVGRGAQLVVAYQRLSAQ